jgi:hypothetical protein
MQETHPGSRGAPLGGRTAPRASRAAPRGGSLGRLLRARIPGLRARLTFGELFRSDPFYVLEEGRNYVLSGFVRTHLDSPP